MKTCYTIEITPSEVFFGILSPSGYIHLEGISMRNPLLVRSFSTRAGSRTVLDILSQCQSVASSLSSVRMPFFRYMVDIGDTNIKEALASVDRQTSLALYLCVLVMEHYDLRPLRREGYISPATIETITQAEKLASSNSTNAAVTSTCHRGTDVVSPAREVLQQYLYRHDW